MEKVKIPTSQPRTVLVERGVNLSLWKNIRVMFNMLSPRGPTSMEAPVELRFKGHADLRRRRYAVDSLAERFQLITCCHVSSCGVPEVV